MQDLPIPGKRVLLEINSYEYKCENGNCSNKTIVESFDGFVSYYSRMTERLAEFLCTLALETSCEGAARIAKNMNIKVSGNTIVKILLKKYDAMKINTYSSIVGIGDFAFRKYIIMELLLLMKKHIKIVTRDRASDYTKAIEKELPCTMQIADRFHIHQNLLQAIKKLFIKKSIQV